MQQRIHAKPAHRDNHESAPAERTEREQKQEQQKADALKAEVAELELASDNLLNKIDEVLALSAGYIALEAV